MDRPSDFTASKRPQPAAGQIAFADGNSWGIYAANDKAEPLVSHFTRIIRSSEISNPGHRLVVRQHIGHNTQADSETLPNRFQDTASKTLICSFPPSATPRDFVLQLRQLSLYLSQGTQERGGLLVHAALAEWQGQGILFAGRPGIGKTTLSRRLPLPWHSFCDDLTLLAQDVEGNYWAHPWPTWSRYLPGKTAGIDDTWNVKHAIPLRKIFFLAQSQEERIETIGRAHAAGLLTRAWRQARFGLPEGLDAPKNTALRVKGFDSICRIVRTIPTSLLYVSLHGAFWQELEKELE